MEFGATIASYTNKTKQEMDKRIIELANKAGFSANTDAEKFEKFAELVIEELVNSMSVENSDLYHNQDNGWGCIAVKFWVEGDPSAMRGEQIQSRFADGSVRGTGSYRLNHEFVRHLMSKHFENKE